MTINYTTLLGLAKPVTGTEANAWGDVVNDQITSLVEDAIANAVSISVSAGNVTLSDNDGATDQARMAVLLITGSPGTSRNIVAPSRSKWYIVRNGSDSSVVVKGSATTGVTIASGKTAMVFWNGSDFQTVASNNVNLTTEVTGTLPVVNGGTGISTFGTGVATALGQNVTGSGGIALGVSSGTYTPTLTSVANVVSTTAETCMYTNVQGVVTVYGRFGIQFNSGTVQVGISLPIASDFTSANDCVGFPTIVLNGLIAAYPPFIYIKADTTNNRADLYYRANSGVTGADSEMYFNFSYRVL
jgi:hypothetical protein